MASKELPPRPSPHPAIAAFCTHVASFLDKNSEDYDDEAVMPTAEALAAVGVFLAGYPVQQPKLLWNGNPTIDLFFSQITEQGWRQLTVRFLESGEMLLARSDSEGVLEVSRLDPRKLGEIRVHLAPWLQSGGHDSD